MVPEYPGTRVIETREPTKKARATLTIGFREKSGDSRRPRYAYGFLITFRATPLWGPHGKRTATTAGTSAVRQ